MSQYNSTRRSVLPKTVLLLIVILCVCTVSAGVATAQPDVSNKTKISENTDGTTVERLVHFDSSGVADVSGNKKNLTTSLQQRATVAQQPLLERAGEKSGITVERQFWIANVALVTVDTSTADPAELSSIENVDTITQNFRVQAINTTRKTTSSGEPRQNITGNTEAHGDATYGLDNLNVPEVWNEYDTRGEGVRVAVLDTGVAPQHPDIELTATEGWAEWNDRGERIDTDPRDYSPVGHGTHVSGTVSGGDASGTHIGVAPETELMHGAVLNQCNDRCFGSGAQILSGMEWAVSNDADVLSMSLGGSGYIGAYIQAINNAERAGTVVIAASGNRGPGTSDSPANVYDTVAVGATDRYNTVADFSSGERIVTDETWRSPPAEWPKEYVVPDVVAPGVNVQSATPDGGYQYLSGTSMATPHIAGIAVLMESGTEEDLTPAEIKDGLTASTVNINESQVRSGNGLATADNAVAAVADQPKRGVEYYTNNDGRVDTNQLFRAVTDWRADQISDTLLQDVISYWRSSEIV